jgi:iron complex transport system permease protein
VSRRRRVVVRVGAGASSLPRMSARLDVRTLVVVGAATALALVAFMVGVGYGDFPISPGDVLATLVGRGSPEQEFIVVDLRLPRMLVSLLVGGALALSGAIFQSLARNPLVAPDIIGINAGAAVVAVAVVVLGLSSALLAPGALLGGLGAAALLYALSYRRGLSTYRLVLVGIALHAAFMAGVSYLLTRGDIFEVQRAVIWLVGSVNDSDWADVRLMGVTLGVLAPVAVVLGRQLEALQLGDDLALATGVPVERARLVLLGLAVVLAAVAVSMTGPIGFVALIAPHIARRLASSSGTGVLAASVAIGGLLVLGADIASQHLLPTPLPVGITTTLLGAPYLLYLLRRAGRLGQAV